MSFLLLILSYVLYSLGMYTISCRRGLAHPWLSWVPFLSCFEGGLDSAIDVRDTEEQGTKYNGSGCLIHGLSIIADSFVAVDCLLRERPQDAQNLLDACKANFDGYEELREYLKNCPKLGQNY